VLTVGSGKGAGGSSTTLRFVGKGGGVREEERETSLASAAPPCMLCIQTVYVVVTYSVVIKLCRS